MSTALWRTAIVHVAYGLIIVVIFSGGCNELFLRGKLWYIRLSAAWPMYPFFGASFCNIKEINLPGLLRDYHENAVDAKRLSKFIFLLRCFSDVLSADRAWRGAGRHHFGDG
ncbi:hypothetical protein [Oleidesulfovibrio alaskensis]|uniref:hypothetical protein n=1 Tax=Oleidesulfovibrio alaskensis TaxID=58180 RepID=UPI00059B9675|nr:hypothetical protein [Oleidesulfovibrio alaskensis]MBG0774420.1 hypothetical protein [Oleidesulfovibrio alaskensis]